MSTCFWGWSDSIFVIYHGAFKPIYFWNNSISGVMFVSLLYTHFYITQVFCQRTPNYHLYTFNAHVLTLNELLIALVLFWIIGFVPWFLRLFLGALLIIWLLASFGIIMVNHLPEISIGVIIFAVGFHRIFYHYSRYRRRYE